jgi:hypothetical protein
MIGSRPFLCASWDQLIRCFEVIPNRSSPKAPWVLEHFHQFFSSEAMAAGRDNWRFRAISNCADWPRNFINLGRIWHLNCSYCPISRIISKSTIII